MIQISLKSEYGLLFLFALSEQKDKCLSLSEISKKYHLPYRFLSQIASVLKKENVIGSKEGKRGGYYLINPLNKLTLHKIISLLDGEPGLIACLRDKKCLQENTCILKSRWLAIQSEIENILTKYTLADFKKDNLAKRRVE
jgi:Rrf2 family protein